MKREIIVEIDKGGDSVVVETVGDPGRQCMQTTQFLEEALGEITTRRLKSEYFNEKARVKGTTRLRHTRGRRNPA